MTRIERAMMQEITRALTKNATRRRPWLTRNEVGRMLVAIADAGRTSPDSRLGKDEQ